MIPQPVTRTAKPIFWLFGLSGAGKSTLAAALSRDLRARSNPVLALDGDDLRAGVCRGLGFSDAERTENLRRAAEVAKLGAASGICVVASFITPLNRHRQLVAEILHGQDLCQIYLDAPLEVCRGRDVKGLYAQAQDGKLPQLTGVSSPFESATTAALVIHTATESLPTCSDRLLKFALSRLSMKYD
jgi:adenylylsulfate kinase